MLKFNEFNQLGWRRKKKCPFKLKVGFVFKNDILIVLVLP